MFDHLFESGRTHSYAIPSIAALTTSALANAAVMMGAVVATAPKAPTFAEVPTREVVYLLPLPPRRTPVEAVGLEWSGGNAPGAGPERPDSAAGLFSAGGGDEGEGAGLRGARQLERAPVDSTIPLGDFDGSTFYVASEVERPVAFDPSSAGPVYPPELQRLQIEGWATLRFIVDTTGSADMSSIKEVDVTHPGFAVAVREALPNMNFRPAELGNRRVAQLVEQQFKFVIQRTALASPADSLPSPADSLLTP